MLRRNVAAAVLAAIVVAGCASEPDLATYFEDVQEAADAALARYRRIGVELNAALPEIDVWPDGPGDPSAEVETLVRQMAVEGEFDATRLGVARIAYANFGVVLGGLASAIREMEPPGEVAAQHEEMAVAAAEWSAFVAEVVAGTEAVTSGADLAAALEEIGLDRFGAFHDRFDTACLAVQAVADEAEGRVKLFASWSPDAGGPVSASLRCVPGER